MRWDLLELTRLARNAGFHRDDVPTAAALAYAISGGIDTYDVRAGSPGVGHYVGLWGVDIDRWPEYAGRTLHAPHVAAQVAHELHRDHNGFAWSATYRIGLHRRYVAQAAVDASRELAAQAPLHVEVPMGAARQVAHLVDGSGRRLTVLNHVRMFRR